MDFRKVSSIVPPGKDTSCCMMEAMNDVQAFRRLYSKGFKSAQAKAKLYSFYDALNDKMKQHFDKEITEALCNYEASVRDYFWVQGLLAAVGSKHVLASESPSLIVEEAAAFCAKVQGQFAGKLPEKERDIFTAYMEEEMKDIDSMKPFIYTHGYEWGTDLLHRAGIKTNNDSDLEKLYNGLE